MTDSTMYDAFLETREKGIPLTPTKESTMTATSLQRANTTRSQLAVEIRGLSKSFGRTKALDGLDLTVAPGDITGFLGPNGAGKSTTHPGAARPAPRRRRNRRGCSAAIPGATRSRCTGGSPTCPAMSRCGPT